MKININQLISLAIFAMIPLFSFSQGIIVNEFSNGPAGSQEYAELVVIGPPGSENCGPVDIGGFYIDDNNGDFSGGPSTGAGIAIGHVRFVSTGAWAAIPTGSIILVYNDAEKNPAITLADDPQDLLVPDGVYILPVSSPLLEGCTSTPNTASRDYSPCLYVASTWAKIGLRNAGDAFQTRSANTSFFHGLSYGSSPLNGGPLGIHLSGSGTGTFVALGNLVDNDYTNASNFFKALVSTNGETPGFPNNAANSLWISSLSDPCLLPVEYALPLTASTDEHTVSLKWATSAEINSQEFQIERSGMALNGFEPIGSVAAHGDSRSLLSYEFVDAMPLLGRSFYRLCQIDKDGRKTFSNVIEAEMEEGGLTLEHIYPNPARDHLDLVLASEKDYSITIFDLLGKTAFHKNFPAMSGVSHVKVSLPELEAGLYLWQIRSGSEIRSGRLMIEQ